MSNQEMIEQLGAIDNKAEEAWNTISSGKDQAGEAIDLLLEVAGGESNLPSYMQPVFDNLRAAQDKAEEAQKLLSEAQRAATDAQSHLS